MSLHPVLLLVGCLACAAGPSSPPPAAAEPAAPPAAKPPAERVGTSAAPALEEGQAEAIFAGGCFWCMEKPFDKVPGVISTTSGYTGGEPDHPAYQQVAMKLTTHLEAIRVVYDPAVVDYSSLLRVFWHNIDPTQSDGQFCDKGPQYRSAVFTADPQERALAEAGVAEVAAQLGKPVVTEVLPAAVFWEAEDYHQDFYVKSPARYTSYRTGCGRDRRLQALWGDSAGH